MFIRKIEFLLAISFASTIFSSCNLTKLGPYYTFKENAEVVRCNTGRFNLLMGIRSKEVIRLSNLARRNPDLLRKYIKHMYGEKWVEMSGVKNLRNSKNKKPLLRPSYLLYSSAKIHSIASGVTGYEGHRGFLARIFVFGNLNCIFVGAGENCSYGSWRAIGQFTSWMGSTGHRANILNEKFYRIGQGSFPHINYATNSVQCFSGPKILDVLLRPQVVFRKKNN